MNSISNYERVAKKTQNSIVGSKTLLPPYYSMAEVRNTSSTHFRDNTDSAQSGYSLTVQSRLFCQPGLFSTSVAIVFAITCIVLVSFFIMASLSEQCPVEKFCFLLGENAAETVLMLNTANQNEDMGKLKYTSGLHNLKMGTYQLMKASF